MMSLINLGSLELTGFEVPARIQCGGAQQLVIHRLIGGARVIDTLGRNEFAIKWSGIFSGSGAGDRARALDVMRSSGSAQVLTWEAFCYLVVIGELHLSFLNPWWIHYDISCAVVKDLAQGLAVEVPDIGQDVSSDLAAASRLLDPMTSASILAASTSLGTGTAEQAHVLSKLAQVQSDVTTEIGNLEQGLDMKDISSVVSVAGSLAMLCCARGFIGRSATNISIELTL